MSIEESKYLHLVSFNQMMVSLQSHQMKIIKTTNKTESKGFQIHNSIVQFYMGVQQRQFYGKLFGSIHARNVIQYTYLMEFVHAQEDCWSKEKQINYSVQEDAMDVDKDKRLFWQFLICLSNYKRLLLSFSKLLFTNKEL